jgi:type II secretory pathway pseudopilin PulG
MKGSGHDRLRPVGGKVRPRACPSAPSGGFTLLEVILALLIMVGIMSVVLFFYQRMAETRRNAIGEAEKVTLVRLLLDQMAGELRAARAMDNPVLSFEGSSNRIRFHSVHWTTPARWMGTNPVSGDLRRIQYFLLAGTNGLEVLGLGRSEDSAFAVAQRASEGASGLMDDLLDGDPDGSTSLDLEGAGEQASVFGSDLTDGGGRLVADFVRSLRFRYYDGTQWVESWNSTRLPLGVEVELGPEGGQDPDGNSPVDVDGTSDVPDRYRRVILVTGGRREAGSGTEGGLVPGTGNDFAP